MELPDGGAAEEPGVVPLHSDFGPAAFQPYALDLASAGLGEEDAQGVLVFVVLARQTGYFIALPELSIAEELLQRGQTAAPQDFLGPSLRVEVASAVLDEDAIQQPPQPLPGRVSPCMLVDFTNEVQGHLAPISSKEELHVLSPFETVLSLRRMLGHAEIEKMSWTGSSIIQPTKFPKRRQKQHRRDPQEEEELPELVSLEKACQLKSESQQWPALQRAWKL